MEVGNFVRITIISETSEVDPCSSITFINIDDNRHINTKILLDGGSYPTMHDFLQLKKKLEKFLDRSRMVTSQCATSSHRRETLQISKGF